MDVTANGLRIHVDEQGPADGPPVLMIMGIAAQLTLWPQGLVDALTARGLRVLRIDNRDVGRSEYLDHLGIPNPAPLLRARMRGRLPDVPYTLRDMALDAIGVLDALELHRAHVVGASMGGMIAQICAVDHPDRVASLTSIMSSPGDWWNSLGSPRAWWALTREKPTTREQAMEARLRVARVFNNGGFPLDEAEERNNAGRDFDRGHHPQGAARQFAAILGTPHRLRELRRLRVPTHVIHGQRDPMMPVRGGITTARLVPGATLQLVRRMGHHLPPGSWEPVATGISEHVWKVEGRGRRAVLERSAG